MNEASLGKKIFTSFIISLVAIAIFIGIGIGFSKIGIPLWPFVFFMFFFTSIDNFDKSKLWPTAIGGLIGILVGMTQGIVTELTLNPITGIVAFAVLAIICVTIFIMGNVPYVNVFTMILITLMTVFTFTASDLGGFPGMEMSYIESLLKVASSYALSVGLFVIISSIMARKALSAQPSVESAQE